MPFHRFLSPEYADGIEEIRKGVNGDPLPSARFVSLLVHGAKDTDAPVTMMLPQWGQFIDHDLTATAQPRSVNGSIPRCCHKSDLHPACLPIKVPRDDPWLAPIGVRCLEFLRSAPAQRRDCVLSWREQTNQVTSYLDGSTVYSSSSRASDNSRIFRDGLLLFGRGPPRDDVCLRGAVANQCIRPGDSRSGEQPGLLAMHTLWVGEHNRIAIEVGQLNPHWSDEKIYQETRRIVGAMIQHITYREYLPLVLGKEVCRLFELELKPRGFFENYDDKANPGIANGFSAAAYRFGHSLIQGSFMRCDKNHRFIDNNVTLHEELSKGDIGGAGSLHRLIRGMAHQRAMKRDEFITPELTNHLFQSGAFPFGLDLAAINIQRGRDHGLPPYTAWRRPCGLSPINSWSDLDNVLGPSSTQRIQQAYQSVDDIDLFVAGLAERPVIGGLIGPTFSCIIAQQFSNLRKGDRFWYENEGFESSFTPAQLQSIRQVSLAQVICRTLGGGTMQPHVFLPTDDAGNERQLCGSRGMSAIDLLPWTELDPFNKNNEISFSKPPTKISKPIDSVISSSNLINKISEITGGNDDDIQFIKDQVQINNKLDFGETSNKLQKPKPTIVDNKLDGAHKKKPTKRPNVTTTTTTTVKTPKVDNKVGTKKRRKHNRRNHHRQLDDRSDTNITDLERAEKPQTKPRKQIFISTPNTNAYKIEIKISPNKQTTKRPTTNHVKIVTGRPTPTTNSHFNSPIEITGDYFDEYNRVTTERPTGLNYLSDSNFYSDNYRTTSDRPTHQTAFSYDVTTKRNEYNRQPITDRQPDYPTYNRQPTTDRQPIYPAYNPQPTTDRQPDYSTYTRYPTTDRQPDYPTYNRQPITDRQPDYSFYNPQPTDDPHPEYSTYNRYPTTDRQPDYSMYNRYTTTDRQPDFSNYNRYPITDRQPEFNIYNRLPTTERQPEFITFYGVQTTKRTTPRPYRHSTTETTDYFYNYGKSDNIPLIEHKSSPNLTTLDYDTSTYSPIHNTDYNDDYEDKLNFDLDGYIRPEHMDFVPLEHDVTDNKEQLGSIQFYYNKDVLQKATEPKQSGNGLYSTGTNNRYAQFYADEYVAFQNDEFVQSRLETQHIDDKIEPNFTDILPRRPTFDIESEDYDDEGSRIKKRSVSGSGILLAPIKVLTLIDRPDNWKMFKTRKRKPLPDMPQLQRDNHASSELPRPMTKLN